MKKWIIILSLVFVGSITASAAIAGDLYYKGMQVYTDEERKELDSNALENIDIESDIPVNIVQTEGKGYVEFKQTFADVLGNPPTYSLEVEAVGDTSYIRVDEQSSPDIWLFVKAQEAQCTIYLPKDKINRLNIKNKEGIERGSLSLNLKGVDINELYIETRYGNIVLEGNYKEIAINQDYGDIQILSKAPAQVVIEGSSDVRLEGKYSTIDVDGNYQRNDVWIRSEIPSDVSVETNGDIKLDGSYKTIEVRSSDSNRMTINSDTLCQVNLSANHGEIYLDGAFEKLVIDVEGGSFYANHTVAPERVNITGNLNDIKFLLPSNIKGFEIINQSNFYNGEDSIVSEFQLREDQSGERMQKFTFGDKSSKFLIQTDNIDQVYILDNGYSSGTTSKIEPTKTQQ